jgi:hypothetical protein
VQPLSLGLKWPTGFVLHLSLRQEQIQLHPWLIRLQDELLSNLWDLFHFFDLAYFLVFSINILIQKIPTFHPHFSLPFGYTLFEALALNF